jgi:phosphohistidine swiveling domain-containing protein
MSFLPSFASQKAIPLDLFLSSEDWQIVRDQKEWYPKASQMRLLFMCPQVMPLGREIEGGIGNLLRCVGINEQGYMRASYDARDFRRLAQRVMEETSKRPGWIDQHLATFRVLSSKLIRLTSELRVHPPFKSLRDLASVYESLIDVSLSAQSYGYITEIFTLTRDGSWALDHVRRLSPGLSESEQEQLMGPVAPSFLQSYEHALRNASSDAELAEVLERYYWVKGSYSALPSLTVESLQEEKAKLSEVVESFPSKQALLEKAASSSLNEFVHVVESSITMQDERKANVLRLNYALGRLVEETSRLVGAWSVEELFEFTAHEFLALLQGSLNDEEQRVRLLQRSEQRFAWVGYREGLVVSSDEAFCKAIDGLLTHEAQTQLKGFVAFKGVVRGKAKIILSERDFPHFQEGDILITSMTRPEFLPVMRRASAFVTNEGGITCHAAIVARELQKPCVIGTRVATTSFKDGEMIEVDAEKGLVRRV